MINQSRYTSIRVDLQVLRRFLLAGEEVKIPRVVVESEFIQEERYLPVAQQT